MPTVAALVAAVAVTVVVLVVVVARRTRGRRRAPALPPDEAIFDPADRAEVAAALDAAAHDEHAAQAARLASGLQLLIERRVPVRTLEPMWSLHAVRVRFADGTAVLLRDGKAGAFGRLAAQVHDGSVCLLDCHAVDEGTVLVFEGRRKRETVVVGQASLDQPE